MTEHTPTPWRTGSSRADGSTNLVEAAHGFVCFCDLELGHDEANAAFIVKAANAYDDLVAALRALHDACVAQGIKFGPLIADAEAALAKAEAQP